MKILIKKLLLITLLFASCHGQLVCSTGQFYSASDNLCEPCFYICQECTSYDYNQCTLCQPLRGIAGQIPINGACECMDNMDETSDGQCTTGTTSYSYSLAVVILLIINCLLVVFTTCAKGMRFFLYRMIEDFQ
jgi:hypothetical protein